MAQRPDGSVVGPNNPAQLGATIRLFATGIGQTDPAIVTNQAGVTAQNVIAAVVGGINNSGVNVVNAQYATGLVGTYYVDLQIPADTIAGLYQPVALAVRSASGDLLFGNTAYVPIR